jgi:hypothetical protein
MTNTKTKYQRPFFKALSDQALVENYWALRALAYNGAEVRSKGLGRILADLDLVINIARKRGLDLLADRPA